MFPYSNDIISEVDLSYMITDFGIGELRLAGPSEILKSSLDPINFWESDMILVDHKRFNIHFSDVFKS